MEFLFFIFFIFLFYAFFKVLMILKLSDILKIDTDDIFDTLFIEEFKENKKIVLEKINEKLKFLKRRFDLIKHYQPKNKSELAKIICEINILVFWRKTFS